MHKAVCFTGHRPDKLGGYNPKDNTKLLWELSKRIEELIVEHKYNIFIDGMALGIDQWCAKIVLKLRLKYPHIKLICAVPCKNHAGKWNAGAQKEWQDIIDQADKVIYVTDEEYTPYCMELRNRWMVDNSNLVFGVWDGTDGGTANCLKYALKKEKTIQIMNPNDYKTI